MLLGDYISVKHVVTVVDEETYTEHEKHVTEYGPVTEITTDYIRMISGDGEDFMYLTHGSCNVVDVSYLV